MSDTLLITVNERLYMAFIDTMVKLNHLTIRKDLVHHNCEASRIQCDMLERECGVPWHTLLIERRRRRGH